MTSPNSLRVAETRPVSRPCWRHIPRSLSLDTGLKPRLIFSYSRECHNQSKHTLPLALLQTTKTVPDTESARMQSLFEHGNLRREDIRTCHRKSNEGVYGQMNPLGNKQDHPLSRTCQNHPICIL